MRRRIWWRKPNQFMNKKFKHLSSKWLNWKEKSKLSNFRTKLWKKSYLPLSKDKKSKKIKLNQIKCRFGSLIGLMSNFHPLIMFLLIEREIISWDLVMITAEITSFDVCIQIKIFLDHIFISYSDQLYLLLLYILSSGILIVNH